MNNNKFYTLREIHDLTRVSVAYLKQLIKNGKLKAFKISRDYIVSQDNLMRFLEDNEVKENGNK